MAETLGNAYINIIPKAPGIEGEISGLLGGPAEAAGRSAGEKAGGGLLGSLKNIIAGGAVALGSAIATLGTAVVTGAKEIADYGDNIDKMSQKLGLSRTAYQEWSAIMAHSGTSIDSMQSSMKTLASAVETGNGAFEALGLSLEDVQGMSNEDLFSATITALQNVDDETQRTYLAGQLLGRGATELGALLNTSAEETEAMRQRVHELGGVLSDETVASSAAFSDALQDMQTALSGVKHGITAQFLPGLTGIMEGFTSLIAGEEGAEEKLAEGFDSILDAVENASNGFFKIVETIIPKMGDVIISHLPQIIEGGMKLIIKLGEGLVKAIPDLLNMLPQIIEGIINAFKEVDWLSLGKDIIDGIILGLKNAGEALWNALKDLAKQAWQLLKDQFKIGSPSKVFADEVGRWIPPGVAVGIEGNMAPLNAAIAGMADASIGQFDRLASASPGYGYGYSAGAVIDYDRLAAAISSRPIVIEGDTGKIFKIVKTTNEIRTKATNYNILAAGARA